MILTQGLVASTYRDVFDPTKQAMFFSTLINGAKASQLTLSTTAITAWLEGAGSKSFIQATGTAQPTYQPLGFDRSNPQASFDGGDHLVYSTGVDLGNNFTATALVKPTIDSTIRTIFSGGTGSPQFCISATNKIQLVKKNTATIVTGATTLVSGTVYMLGVQSDGVNASVFINGVQDATVASNPAFSNVVQTLGASSAAQFFLGGIAALLVSRGSSLRIRQQQEQWITSQYGY